MNTTPLHSTDTPSLARKPWSRVCTFKILAYIAIFVYSALRALPLMFVEEFHGSILVIWLMDILTAIPYTWGLLEFAVSARSARRWLGLTIAIVTFAAPYIYFWSHGNDYPLGVTAIVIAMIVGAILWEAIKYVRTREKLHSQQCIANTQQHVSSAVDTTL